MHTKARDLKKWKELDFKDLKLAIIDEADLFFGY